MISQTAVSLRAWHPNGYPISGSEFANALASEASRFALVGSGKEWEASRIVGFELSLEAYNEMDEPHEAYSKALNESFSNFTGWLSTLSLNSLDMLRAKGVNLDVFITFWIDQNQFELALPAELMAEMGRLRLPITMLSND
jgi:hypothetical protein